MPRSHKPFVGRLWLPLNEPELALSRAGHRSARDGCARSLPVASIGRPDYDLFLWLELESREACKQLPSLSPKLAAAAATAVVWRNGFADRTHKTRLCSRALNRPLEAKQTSLPRDGKSSKTIQCLPREMLEHNFKRTRGDVNGEATRSPAALSI